MERNPWYFNLFEDENLKTRCHMDMETLEEQLEAFKRCSMELIDLEITKAKSPRRDHQEEITKAVISSLNGITRWIENVLSTYHQEE